jgi:hypothetical protein
MFTIQAENPSIRDYIEELGREKIEELVLNYLKVKAQFHKLSIEKKDTKPSYKDFGISEETHRKLLALKPRGDNQGKEKSHIIDEISDRCGDKYSNISLNDIRDEYFASKGY